MHNQGDIGSRGENAAALFLTRERGFTLVTRNWRNPRDLREDIDLVCRDREVLVFVEVKTRSLGALVPGYFAVDRRKKQALRRAIRAYLRLLRHKPHTFRFDIVEIEGWGPGGCVHHFENVDLFSRYFRA